MHDQDTDILKSLKAFPPTNVYQIASKECVVRGYDYYTKERLESFRWTPDRSSLLAPVMGTIRYTIKYFMQHDVLHYACDCPAWTPGLHCKHVICALLTTINLLSPDVFRVPRHRGYRIEALKTSLLTESSNKPIPLKRAKPQVSYELVIDVKTMVPTVYLRKNGKLVESAWDIPQELELFSSYGFRVYTTASQQFSNYVTQYGNIHQLILETSHGETALQWDASLLYQPKTQLHVTGDHLQVTALCMLNSKIREQVCPFWNFVADLETGTLALLEDTGGWQLYHRLSMLADRMKAQPSESQDVLSLWATHTPSVSPWEQEAAWMSRRPPEALSCQLPVSHFQSIQLTIPGKDCDQMLHNLLLKVDGQAVAPLREDRVPIATACQYHLTIKPQTEPISLTTASVPLYTLKPECWWGADKNFPSLSTFRFFPVVEHSRSLPTPLKAQKRKTTLYETFFQFLNIHQQTEAERIIKISLSGHDFRQRQIKASATILLRHYFSTFVESELRLSYVQGQWFVIPMDKPKEALLYLIPFEVFGQQVFRGMSRHDEMTLPGTVLHARLAQLYEKCTEAGISLSYNDKPIVTATWDFLFDARRTTGIDWFEIRPEIKVEGKMIDHDIWREALDNGGMVELDGTLQLLDTQSQDILRSLAIIYQTNTKRPRQKRDIVRIPRLRILDWIALRKHGVRVHLPEEDEALIERLTQFEQLDTPVLPQRLQATLRPYQRDGYTWLAFLYQHQFGACLADDMGLGKTIQAISLLGGIHEGILKPPTPVHHPHLVVLPPSLLFNWEQEINRFYPDLRIHFYTGKERSTAFKGADVVLTTYGLVRRDIARIETIPFHVIIFDEAQAVKNIFADTTSAVRRLTGTFKMVMTGTPLENHVGEYYSLIDLCLPGLLGNYEEFKPQINAGYTPILDTLLHRTKPFILRRTKEKILKELPAKTETDVYLELTPHQKTLYKQTVAQIRPTIDEAYRQKTQAQARIIALTAILKLRQLCVSPRLLDAPPTEPSPKILFVLDRLKELMEAGHSALVFSQFTSFLDLVDETLQAESIPFFRLDGSTPTAKRKGLVKEFQE